MDDGGLLVEAAFAGGEVGFTDGRALAGGVEADLIERIAQGGAAALGDVVDLLGVARFGGDQVIAGQGPDLAGGGEVAGVADGGQVTGGQ
jgi:hypothetical protein